MFTNALADAIDAAHPKQLDELSRHIWQAHAAGHIPDNEAQSLAERLHSRRGESGAGRGALFSVGGPHTAATRYRIQRSPEQKSPDRRASIRRRREHAACGILPPNIASSFTVGQQAVLRILAEECLAHGASDRSRNEYAARAGVSLTVVKQAIKYAERDGLISVLRRPRSGRKHLPNIIRIIRAEWLVWLDKGHRKAHAITACNRAKPDFQSARGAQKNPPRAQLLGKGSAKEERSGRRLRETVEASQYRTRKSPPA